MLNLETSTFPVLHTEQLVLRQLAPEYAAGIHQLRSDPEVNRYLDRPTSASVDDAIAFINKIKGFIDARQSLYWVITLAGDNGQMIGTIGLWNFDNISNTIELGYELMTPYQGRGLMSEAISRVIQYAFEQMNAKVLTAFTTPDNNKSVTLLNKFGFTADAELQATLGDDAELLQAYSLNLS